MKDERMKYDPEKPFAVVHIHQNGDIDYWSSEGVQLFVVDENAPGDRIYRTSGVLSVGEAAKILGTDEIGSKDDGSPANARAHAVVAYMDGRSHLTLVPSLNETDGEG